MLAGSLLGGWLGSHAGDGPSGTLTALVGAILGGNLALLAIDLVRQSDDHLVFGTIRGRASALKDSMHSLAE